LPQHRKSRRAADSIRLLRDQRTYLYAFRVTSQYSSSPTFLSARKGIHRNCDAESLRHFWPYWVAYFEFARSSANAARPSHTSFTPVAPRNTRILIYSHTCFATDHISPNYQEKKIFPLAERFSLPLCPSRSPVHAASTRTRQGRRAIISELVAIGRLPAFASATSSPPGYASGQLLL